MSGIFFKVVVQVVLIFGSETRVMTHRMGWYLGGFPEQGGPSDHKKIDAVASGLKLVEPPFGGGDGGVNMGGGFVVGGVLRLEEEEYVRVVLLIMYLCEEVVQSLGTWISKRSW